MNENLNGKRTALYVRVSSEEQALKGYSLEAQLADLTNYAEKHHMIIYDKYIDAGTTARKKLENRVAFQRMIRDIKDNQLDMILFIRLDRWFRNVADYYRIQSILDEHKVEWKCTQENYDTTTANGRLALNIKLSIAQDEADRTSERIKFVQANKVKNGEVITGSLPFGLKIKISDGKKVMAIDKEKVDILKDAFDYFAKCHSKRATRIYIADKYQIFWTDQTFNNMLNNDLYAGIYRGNADYCPAIFDIEYLQTLRDIRNRYTQHTRKAKYTYIFGGILRCSECGNQLGGIVDPPRRGRKTTHYYYRCSTHANYRKCTNKFSVSELRIEAYILDHIVPLARKYKAEYEITSKEIGKRQAEKASITRKLNRLKDLYVNELIDMDTYKKDYTDLKKRLDGIRPPKQADFSKIDTLLQSDFRNIYEKFTRQEKRRFWRSILKTIVIHEKEIIDIVFL